MVCTSNVIDVRFGFMCTVQRSHNPQFPKQFPLLLFRWICTSWNWASGLRQWFFDLIGNKRQAQLLAGLERVCEIMLKIPVLWTRIRERSLSLNWLPFFTFFPTFIPMDCYYDDECLHNINLLSSLHRHRFTIHKRIFYTLDISHIPRFIQPWMYEFDSIVVFRYGFNFIDFSRAEKYELSNDGDLIASKFTYVQLLPVYSWHWSQHRTRIMPHNSPAPARFPKSKYYLSDICNFLAVLRLWFTTLFETNHMILSIWRLWDAWNPIFGKIAKFGKETNSTSSFSRGFCPAIFNKSSWTPLRLPLQYIDYRVRQAEIDT